MQPVSPDPVTPSITRKILKLQRHLRVQPAQFFLAHAVKCYQNYSSTQNNAGISSANVCYILLQVVFNKHHRVKDKEPVLKIFC